MIHRYLALVAAASLASALAVPALAAPPHQFLKQAIEGDNSEIMLGKLAQQRADSSGVRDFGQTLVQDHSMAKEQALPLAQRFGVHDTDAVMPMARQERRKLEHMSGRQFDREFVRYMVKDHKEDIRKFDQQAHGAGPVADLARQTLPTLHKHLDIAEHLQGQG